ncbi:aminotransferase class V-fold PLP-dependent enzyme [candidate division CSSED10-310 bacterium]|uniref:cysteine desulfurase n=1 Tax=candidate division CSSED10-310 bacterium TaxID=2855610 RepID=A0ABV6YUW1_UNCC1
MNKSGLNAPTERPALCGICPAACWVLVTYDAQGKIDTVRPDDSSQFGAICKLGEQSRDIVYSKDRLLYPLRRKGPKGTYQFERITWDEAFVALVENLQKVKAESGPEATAIYTGRGSFELALCDVYQPEGVAVSSASSVLFPFGSPNTLGVGALCYVSFAMIAPHVTMGGMLITMFSDIENAELIVVWGANPATDCPPLDLQRIVKARRQGAQVVVIDPRRTMTAQLTEAEWIPIRPGTDGALALGLCQVLIEEELYDEPFVKKWVRGFDDFARYVQHFRPQEVENITGIPADTVRSLAKRIYEAHGAAPVMYTGLEYSDSGVQAIRATFVLWALAGQLDVPGGRCFTMPQNHFRINRERLIANPDVRKALGRDRFPVYSSYRGESHAIALPEAVLDANPYQVRSLIILGGSIITSWPQPAVWKKTLNALDFLVCIDRQLTADAAFADIVLPATTNYEIESYMVYGPLFRIREKIIEPVGEARNDFFILAELAARLGYGHLYPQNEEELLQYVLQGSGFTVAQVRESGGIVQIPTVMMQYKKWEKGLLRSDGQTGFETPSTLFEISSSILEEHGYDPLPLYTEPHEGPLNQPTLAQKFPLVFNSGARVTSDFRSQHHGVPALIKERPEPTVTIHTTDATVRGIKNGDRVLVESPRGQVSMRAFVTDNIVSGTIDANMGGGGPVGPAAWQQCNVNELTDLQRFDPISGFPIYKALLCDVVKADGESSRVEISSGEYTSIKDDEPDRAAGEDIFQRIYLDHNATTPIHPDVKLAMSQAMDLVPGNPSSIYEEGRNARTAMDQARRKIAQLLNCTARRIIFTGCGSEANNFAIKGVAFSNANRKNHIITSTVEHPSVLATCRWLETQGFRITYLPVDRTGRVDPDQVLKAISPRTCLVTIMMANNETGTIQPIADISRVAREHDLIFHTDCVQAAGKIPLDMQALDVDLATISGHKFHGPKGVGALFVRKDVTLEGLVHGGKQENGLRAGTENIIGIVGFGKASELAVQRLPLMKQVRELSDTLKAGISRIIPGARLNGHETERLPNTLNFHIPGMRGESVVLALDRLGISLSSGSACRAGSPDPSHALLALGLTQEQAHCSIRLSLGLGNNFSEIERVLTMFKEVIENSKSIIRFVPCR